MTFEPPSLVSEEAQRLFGEIANLRDRRAQCFERDMRAIDREYDARVDQMDARRWPMLSPRLIASLLAVLILFAILM